MITFQVTKTDVDTLICSEILWVPCSHYRAKFHGAVSPVPDLECSVIVKGAKQTHNQFTVDINPKCTDMLSVANVVATCTLTKVDQLLLVYPEPLIFIITYMQ